VNRTDAAINMGVVVLPGVSHMQYASGTPPLLVKARDLLPEISYEAAHAAMSHMILAFLQVHTCHDQTAATTLLNAGRFPSHPRARDVLLGYRAHLMLRRFAHSHMR
jgi:hypothetical protein